MDWCKTNLFYNKGGIDVDGSRITDDDDDDNFNLNVCWLASLLKTLQV